MNTKTNLAECAVAFDRCDISDAALYTKCRENLRKAVQAFLDDETQQVDPMQPLPRNEDIVKTAWMHGKAHPHGTWDVYREEVLNICAN